MKASLGVFGETYASHRLHRLGYEILDRNVRFPGGEIDIVARQGGEIVFVEVKTRRSTVVSRPEDALSRPRMRHLEAAIDAYLLERGLTGSPYRIEIVALELDRSGRVTRCDILGDVGLR